MSPRREEPELRSTTEELTATLWCAAVLLAVLLLACWGLREIYAV